MASKMGKKFIMVLESQKKKQTVSLMFVSRKHSSVYLPEGVRDSYVLYRSARKLRSLILV